MDGLGMFFCTLHQNIAKKIALKGELVLVIDGSETAGDCETLMLSVIWRKYAIPLAWLTKKEEKSHFPEDWHVELTTLTATIIPSDCRVVLLGDGEFDGQKLRAKCKYLKWEFVLRTILLDIFEKRRRKHDFCVDLRRNNLCSPYLRKFSDLYHKYGLGAVKNIWLL